VLETLRYADEVNKAQSYFRDIGDTKPDEDLLDLATSLIEKKSGKFDAAGFHDRYVDALKDLIDRKRKAKGGKVSLDDDGGKPAKGGSNVIDLMAALRKSVGGDEKPAAAAAKKAPAKKAPAKKPAPRPRKSA
jgi:DNA end-binding protein Ku